MTANEPTDGTERKRQRVRLFQKYLLNPPAKAAVRAGLVPGYVLIETVGRKSGKPRRTVVGMHFEGAVGWVVAEHGHRAAYVRNIEANPKVRVCRRGRWRDATADVVAEDDAEARLEGFGRRTHAATLHRFGTELLSVRFTFE